MSMASSANVKDVESTIGERLMDSVRVVEVCLVSSSFECFGHLKLRL